MVQYKTKQDTTACTAAKFTQVYILIFTCLWEYLIYELIHAKGKALICAHNTGIPKLNGIAQASLYIHLCTFPTHFHNGLLPFAWVSIDDKSWQNNMAQEKNLIPVSLIKWKIV